MGKHEQQLIHGGVRSKIIVIFCPLPAPAQKTGGLQNLNVVGDGRAGEMGLLGDGPDADPTALSHAHQLQNQMLAVLVAEGEQDLPAAAELLGKPGDIILMV